MAFTRRTRYMLSVTLGYLLFATAWIFFSDSLIAELGDHALVTKLSMIKGLLFIVVTAGMLWMALDRLPPPGEVLPVHDKPPCSHTAGLIIATAIPFVALGLQLMLWGLIKPFVWFFFYPAIFFSSWVGRLAGGLIACVLSVIMVWFFFLPPEWSFALDRKESIVSLGLFFAVGVLFSFTHEHLRRAERKNAEHKFKALVEQSLAGIYIIQDGHLKYVNPRFAEIFGYDSPEQIIGRVPALALVCAADRPMVQDGLERRLKGLVKSMSYVFKGLRTDGSLVDIEAHGQGFTYQERPAVIGLILDITERCRAEANFRRTEQLMRAVVNGSTDAIFVKDADGSYLLANEATARFVGKPVADILGQTDLDLFPPDTAAKVMALDRAIMVKGSPRNAEEHITTADGQTFAFSSTKGPVFDDHSQVVGLFGIARDITDNIRTQVELHSRQVLLDNMSEIAKVGGWCFDVATMTGTWTPGVAHILDIAIGDTATLAQSLDFFEGEHREKIATALKAAIEHGTPYDLELEIVSAKGVHKWVRTQSHPVMHEGKVVRVEGAMQDITETRLAQLALENHQARLEEQVQERTAALEASRREAERLAQIKSEFLANMSHEIRTPLNGILGLAQIGQRDSEGRSAGLTFGRIMDSGKLLLGVINDILDFSKIEAGKLKIESIPMNLHKVLNDAREIMADRAAIKGIALVLDEAPDLPPACLGDPLRLEQVLMNLLSNAIKFTEGGQVQVKSCREGEQLLITISDTGIGMSPEQLGRLFTAFEQADNSTTRKFGGTGLGLVITRRLVEMMSGTISARSELGVGSSFEVRLPLVAAEAQSSAPILAPQHPATVGSLRLKGLTLLAAEDNEINQFVLQDFLVTEGARVVMVGDGAEAVARIRQEGAERYDLVLMDIQMPIMDGYSAAREILALAPQLPIIGQTAHALVEEREKCLAAGMRDQVVKPLDAEVLVATILRHTRPGDGAAHAPTSPDTPIRFSTPAGDTCVRWADLNTRYERKPHFLLKLLNLALNTQSETPAKLRAFIASQDMEQLRFVAHSLKSVAGNLMADDLLALATQTEQAAKAGAPEAANLGENLAGEVARLLLEVQQQVALIHG